MRSSDIALVVLLIVVAVLAVSSARMDAATTDEPAHIAAGMVKLQYGWLNLFREQPPLMNSLSALPVMMAGYRMPDGWQSGPDHWTVGRKFLYYSHYDAHRILFLARLMTILLFLDLVFAVYLFVKRQTGNAWWALGAAALTGFCPNLMAHGRLITVDFALTFFAFTATVYLLAMIERPSIAIAIFFGISAVAAPMSKVSGLILGPYFAAVIIAAFMFKRVRDPKRFVRAVAVSVAAGLLFFECFTLAEMSSAYIHFQYPHTPRLFVPFADYLDNVKTIRAWYAHGHELPQFLLGRFSRSGWPYYYLVAFLLKTTLPAIFLTIAAIVAGVRKRSFAFFALLGFVVLFMVVAGAGHLDLGLRYVLPIYPFLYAAIAIGLYEPRASSDARSGVAVALAVLVIWHIAENLANYPSYIAYFNESIGSKRNADKFLIDSNLDWGQDLRRLDQWCRHNDVRRISIQYFGGGDIEYDMRFAEPDIRWAPEPSPIPKGYFALSRHLYRIGMPLWGVDYDEYLKAQHASYVTSIGGSINIYRVE